MGSSWGNKYMTNDGYILNNGLSLFTYSQDPLNNSTSENSFYTKKQPRGLMTPIITYNKLNLCQRRFSISYSHEHQEISKKEDFALTGYFHLSFLNFLLLTLKNFFIFKELTQVILRILTDVSMYENATSYKRVQYLDENDFCYEGLIKFF